MGRKGKFERLGKGGYMKYKAFFIPEEGTTDKLLNDGTWLPTSICAVVMGCSVQTIREAYISQKIRVMKFDKGGPLLIRLEDLWKFSSIEHEYEMAEDPLDVE